MNKTAERRSTFGKVVSALCAITLIVGLLPVSPKVAYADPLPEGPTVTVASATTTVGGEVSLPITLSGGQQVTGYNIQIVSDPALERTNIELASGADAFNLGMQMVNQENGKMADVSIAGKPAQGTLCTAHFKAPDTPGEYTVTVEFVEGTTGLIDLDNNDWPTTVVAGKVTVTEAQPQYLWGGETITESGTYVLGTAGKEGHEANATGTITIGEGVNVTLQGAGTDGTAVFTDLGIVVGDGSELTLQDVHINLTSTFAASAIDFQGTGTLKVANEAVVERIAGETGSQLHAVIHVANDADVTFAGDGTFYGFKVSNTCVVGPNMNTKPDEGGEPSEPMGNITFDSGEWLFSGNHGGQIIGNGATATEGTITINGGAVHSKTMAMGAAIGGYLATGIAPNVVINGGLVETDSDWGGSGIGCGGNATEAGTLIVNGGSIKTVINANAYGRWGITSDASAVVDDVAITAAHDTAMYVLDASAYADQDSIAVKVDGADFYTGGLYKYVANQVKLGSGYPGVAKDNWLANDKSYKPATEQASSEFAPDTNLYLQLTKENHTISVGDDSFDIVWNEEAGAFEPAAPASQYLWGGETITESGTYVLGTAGNEGHEANATGTITVGEGINVTIEGAGLEESGKFTNLNVVVGDSSELTLKNTYIFLDTQMANSAVDFQGTGSLLIEGVNMIEHPDQSKVGDTAKWFEPVIHVGSGNNVTFGGEGTLYGYKNSCAAFIGPAVSTDTNTASEAMGNITFEGGTWLLKGSKTGPLVGNDTTATEGVVTVNGGNLYLKAVAMGSCIGASKGGIAPNVVINGGAIETLSDWGGAAIGRASAEGIPAEHYGAVTINGGSIKSIITANGYSAWGITSDAAAVVNDIAITAAHDTAMYVLDASAYAGQDSITVKVDGADFYTGGLYQYTTNEAKNPDTCMENWALNTDAGASVSTFAPDTNLYLQLSKQNHTISVGDDSFDIVWNAEDLQFEPAAQLRHVTEINNAGDLGEFAASVNAGLDYTDKTVNLNDDIQLEGEWTPIGTAENPFNGIFVGNSHTISGLSITNAAGGYKGLFGNNAGMVANFAIDGAVTIDQNSLAANSDGVAAAVGVNTGQVWLVTNYADVTVPLSANGGKAADNIYGIGGIVGDNRGVIMDCENTGNITGAKSVGGVVGRSYGEQAVISGCCNSGDVTGVAKGKDAIGGVVGSLGNKDSVTTVAFLEDCYNLGTVTNDNGRWIGGIAGFATKGACLSKTYNAGTIGAAHSNNGGLICYADSGVGSLAKFENNYALQQDDYAGTSENGTILTSEQLGEAASLLGPSFKSSYMSYPVLWWQRANIKPAEAAERIAGNNRYETAGMIVDKAFPEGEVGGTVIVATGQDFADALAASGLAGLDDAPIILVQSNKLPAAASEQLERLQPSEVIIIGGDVAISKSVESSIAKLTGVTPQRIAGDTRYSTALEIYEAGDPEDWSDTCILATGANFADALSIAPYAYACGAPIFLVHPKSGISSETLQAIEEGGFTEVIVIGGTGAVPASVDASLDELGPTVERIAGKNRYETSRLVAEFACDRGMTLNSVGVATGENFPDALAGCVLCGLENSVLLLSSETTTGMTAVKSIITKGNAWDIEHCYIFGGTGAVPQSVEDYINSQLNPSLS